MTIRRKCSECGEDLSFSEHDPCDNCSVLKFDLQFIPRATVAAALRELRAEMFNYAPVAAIDATIAREFHLQAEEAEGEMNAK